MSDMPYVTERTKRWRTRDIQPSFVKAIDTIEEFGCQILSVEADRLAESWSYTTGVYDNCGKPELIVVGLPRQVAGSALNEAVARLRKGVDLSVGRHDDIIGNVQVEFRPVDPRWLHRVMLRTSWFYEGADVPALQLIFPDLQNRFPPEAGFDKRFDQPILSGVIRPSALSLKFWASNARQSESKPSGNERIPLLN
jgi:hypothetical protein